MTALKKNYNDFMPNEVLFENLRQLLMSRGISETELARQTNLPQPTIHKIMSGKTLDPRMSTLKSIASYFEVTLDQLCFDKHFFAEEIKSANKSVPILTWQDCDNALDVKSKLKPSNWMHWAAVDGNIDTSSIFGLITKPSMEPCFPRETILIINANSKPIDGDFVIIQHKGSSEATVRELSLDGPNKLLLPLNRNTLPEKLDSSIHVIGSVIQSRFLY
jgi:transcriptional regulator with XRE-family HTH domain